MSRGPGRWQRAILDCLGTAEVVVLTREDDPKAVQNAVRRAAARLEQEGRIRLIIERIEGRPRLAAVAPESSAPQARITVGLDGKKYRR